MIAYDADGARRWSHVIAANRGIPALAVDAGGRVVATSRHDYDHPGHVSVFGAGGALVWERELPVLVEQMVVEPDGGVTIAGNVVDKGMLVDLDPDAPGTQPAELLGFAADGSPRAPVPVPTGTPAPAGPDLRLATDGRASYVGWNVLHSGTGIAGRLMKLVDGKPVWTHEVPAIHQLAGAGTRVALVTEDGGKPTALLLDGDGATVATWQARPERVRLGGEVAVEAIGASATALVLTGFAEKRLDLGAAGTVTSECWTEEEREGGDPPRAIEVPQCAEAAFVVRYPLPATP